MHKTMLSIAAAAGVALGCALTGMAAETQVPGMPLIAGADGAGGYAPGGRVGGGDHLPAHRQRRAATLL